MQTQIDSRARIRRGTKYELMTLEITSLGIMALELVTREKLCREIMTLDIITLEIMARHDITPKLITFDSITPDIMPLKIMPPESQVGFHPYSNADRILRPGTSWDQL